MSRKHQLAFSILSSQPASFLWRSADPRALRILAYHRVLDDDLTSFPFDEGVVSATLESFRHQMRFVKENFDVLTFKDLAVCDEAGRPWPKRALIVTFDDGYLDNYRNVLPILKEFGITATVFLAVAHIDSGELFWWDKISYLIKHAQNDTLEYSPMCSSPLPLATCSDRSRVIIRVLEWIKSVPENVKSEFLARLPELSGCSVPKRIDRMHLNWNEVREMASSGIEFGSHTFSHPVLPNVTAAELEREVTGSKRRIEEELTAPVVTFSYPVGRFNEEVEAAVRRAGYRYAVSYKEGVTESQNRNQFLLPRIHVEPEVTIDHFRSVLMFPRILLRREG